MPFETINFFLHFHLFFGIGVGLQIVQLIPEISVVFEKSLTFKPDLYQFGVPFCNGSVAIGQFPISLLNFPLFFVQFTLQFRVARTATLHFTATV